MKKALLALMIVAFCFTVEQISAQYLTAIGVRAGSSTGLTAIQYFSPKSRGAADFHVATKYHGILITGLYELHSKNHNENIELANVGFFIGIGGHFGSFKGKDYGMGNKKTVVALGVDATAGVEWKIPGAPLLLSLDLRPYYEWVKDVSKPLDFLDYGISLRYVFR